MNLLLWLGTFHGVSFSNSGILRNGPDFAISTWKVVCVCDLGVYPLVI